MPKLEADLRKITRVNLKSPDVVIFVSVFKSVVGMSILPKYYELKKYNIPSICS